jgi:BolA protein
VIAPASCGTLEERIAERLAGLAPSELVLTDESGQHIGHAGARGGGGHYRLTITAACFQGCSPMARHRMVYAALGDLMNGPIHALALRTRAPGEA